MEVLTTRPARPALQTIVAYANLTKPRIVALLLATTVVSMLLAADGMPPPHLLVLTMLGGALGAGGANAINNYMDRDIDRLMARTASRGIPSGIVPPETAFFLGVGLLGGSALVLALGVNALSAVLTLAGALFYLLVYTAWLKRSSVHNIVIGGAAGAVPPLVGWAAVTGGLSPLAFLLFAIVFVWTPPHFWALALLLKDDYKGAHIPMLPVVRGERETRRQIALYAVLLIALTLLVARAGLFGTLYLASALALGAPFLYLAWRLIKDPSAEPARHLFRYSIVYLALLFAAMATDRLL